MDNKNLCLSLAYCETEKDVIKLLKNEGYWDNTDEWRFYGDNENNFATIGNQQSKSEAAIVEKIINSVDAVLMSECLKKGINPESPSAPKSIVKALELFFNIDNGKLSNITSTERKQLAENISLVATGKKTNPCYSIIDKGEGQTPNNMPDTLLSIGKSNKLRIPFVQGKFNMGGTGVFQFCGKHNLQLIISKRNPEIVQYEKVDDSSSLWGFTIVRREDPKHGVRSSCYRYLAPKGKVLTFITDSLLLLPGEYPKAYDKALNWGTFIKLYEYQMIGLRTNILFDLYNRLSLLMPSIALPIRFYERRKGYSGHSLETTLAGLSVRLDEDKTENLEKGFDPPPTSTISVSGQKMKISIYAFKRGQSEKYTKNEGIIFTVNGQTHGFLPRSFFSRQNVRMGYLADSLLILVDCSEFDGRAREDLFMNSRDRLRSGDLRSNIEIELSDLLRNHPGLKDLRESRRREDIENKLEDSKPLAEVIETIIKKSPTLSNLFTNGVRLPNPFKIEKSSSNESYKGNRFPTFFKLIKTYNEEKPKHSPLNTRTRIQYKTDVENNYFDRDSDPGNFTLRMNDENIQNFSINLWNGIATLNIEFPDTIRSGELLHFQSEVSDISRVIPFKEDFHIFIVDEIDKSTGTPGNRKPPSSDKEGSNTEKASHLDLPNVIEVSRDNWEHYNFNRDSALKVIDSGEDSYDFYINMDNIHLLTEKKANSQIDGKLLDARYKYGMVLIGLALLNDYRESQKRNNTQNDSCEMNIYEVITNFSRTISPILLPMISGLGDLQEEEIRINIDEES